MPLDSQELEIVHVSTSQFQVTFCVDKGLVTPPLGIEMEQVQVEPEREPRQISTNEVSKEGQIGEKPQQTSQDTKVRTVGSTKIKTIQEEPS